MESVWEDERKRKHMLTAKSNARKVQKATASCVIDPRNSNLVNYWDAITTTALMYVALVTPYEVGFVEPSNQIDGLFITNRIVDLVFIFDCVLQFFLMVSVSTAEGTMWVSSPAKISRIYLRGWFPIDAASIGVSVFDYIGLEEFSIAESVASSNASDGVTDASNAAGLSQLRTLRVLRALRLIKLSKLLTGLRVVKRWEVKVAINYPALSLGKCCIGMLLLSHWFACIWGLQASFAESKLDTWFGGYNLCVADTTVIGGLRCVGAAESYVAALYWAVMTLTSIGYGDISATQGNIGEHVVATLIMISGAIGWGLVLGVIVGNLSNLDPDGDLFTQTMSELNKMMGREELPNEMRIRLREYFHQTQHVRMTNKRSELLALMSPNLQAEVAWECSKGWLSKIWFLEGSSNAFLVRLSLRLTARVFAPGEIAPAGPMYIVHRGIALFGGRVKGPGRLMGEDMIIISSPRLQNRYSARAMTFLAVFTITREDLNETASNFPKAAKLIRRKALQLAMKRAFVVEAKKAKVLRQDWSEPTES